MGRIRSCRPAQRLSHTRSDAPNAVRFGRVYRPRLELLEDRVQLGDTILGLSAVALWGLGSNPLDAPRTLDPGAQEQAWHHGLFSSLDATGSVPAVFLRDYSRMDEAGSQMMADRAITAPTTEAVASAIPISMGDDPLAGQIAVHRLASSAFLSSPALAVGFGVGGGGGGAPGLGGGVLSSPAAPAGIGDSAGRSPQLFTAAPPLSFDVSTGQLAIRPGVGEHTVREAPTANGFVDVAIDGKDHSSDPSSPSFDSALAGASSSNVAGIRFAGGGQDTLTLGSQHVAAGFTVQAAGATVVTENVVTPGSLAIQAPNITVNGALQASTVALAASGWVTVNAGGRIDAPRAASGGRIDVAAGVFVNSGQLHADRPTGGQINVQAGNILNAGPMTANATDPSASGGQIHIAFTGSYVATTAAVVSASNEAGPGGQLVIDGGNTGRLYSSGHHLATGSVGGAVDLVGREVVLAGATVDASGEVRGGSVRIANAQTVTVTPASTIRADAVHTGSGGHVFVAADQSVTFDGTVSARAGSAGGSGGFIEVSGHGDLRYGGSADAGARSGKSGTLLLDPKNITIGDAPAGVFPQFDLIDPHPTPGGGFGTYLEALGNRNVVVTNPKDDFGGPKAGAAYLFDGSTGALISSLVGSHPNDQVGSAGGYSDPITLLSNGNYVVQSVNWNSDRGAVTWASASTGVSGVVSEVNSLVGGNAGDQVGNAYPAGVTPLSNGNYLVRSPNWNGNRGAVTWGNGSTGVSGIVSETNSLIGSNPGNPFGSNTGDLVGFHLIVLSNGNYLVESPFWFGRRGAVTWGNGSTGTSGTVSDANSLVGVNDGVGSDEFGSSHVSVLSNGNYLVESPDWKGGRGAVTWGNGSTGTSGTVSDVNSLIGSNAGDLVGSSAIPLKNGNYVVGSPAWNGRRGAVTWGNGSTGVSGTISDANSLVGKEPNDYVGTFILPLRNGNYVVDSPYWNVHRGAVTWGNGITAISGTISEVNSLVGSNAGDLVGFSAIPLNNGNYVVGSPNWNGRRGAVTWGKGITGVSGTVSDANSLVGSNPNDQVGYGLTPLSNDNYVVSSPYWNGGFTSARGAVTWGNGSTGISGTVSEANSLVGSNPGDLVGSLITLLSNGNYVVDSPYWNGGYVLGHGAVTWADGGTGTSGTVSEANSLVGSNSGDLVGSGYYSLNPSLTLLNNGNYVVQSPHWNRNRGAVTWGNGSTGTSGTVSDANSLVGSNPGDGNAYGSKPGDLVGYLISPLGNGNYLVESPTWNGFRGAVTWGNGSTGTTGILSDANSLVGSNARDLIGGTYFVHIGRPPIQSLTSNVLVLRDGNYLVGSPYWNGGRGAVTWGNGSTGVSGIVSDANSLVGSNSGDAVGAVAQVNDYHNYYGLVLDVSLLSNGNYLVSSRAWNGGRGAVTWLNGASGQTLDGLGTITPQNSLVGSAVNAGLGNVIENPADQTFLAPFSSDGTGRVVAGFADPNRLTYVTAQTQSVTVTPTFLTATLNTGTAVILQASNDITVNSPITASAGGKGGGLTLQAGRSIVLNAPIITNNGALTLIANDQVANGVVDAQRDPGNAVITMAPGTAIDTGSGPLTIELRDGAGLTNARSGAITLQSVTAGSVSVVNNGPNPGSDVDLGSVTTSGSQSYADPNGTTNVTGYLTAADNPITFNNSLVVNDGVTLNAGVSTVNFAGSGTQTLQNGPSTTFVNLNHTGTGTLQLTSGLAVTGTLTNSAGIFDANDQPVTVTGPATVAGGTYLAGTAPQTFSGGLSITGAFTSANGPMTVNGPIAVLGGQLNAAGAVGSVTAIGGIIAPGGTSPGVLSVAGAVTFFGSTIFSILCNGPLPGSDYSQLQASGPITLANSFLTFVLGFQPPVGSSFEILTNTGSVPITGRFNGLDEGAIFSQGGYQFQITYQRGTGGDSVVLTRVA